MFTTGARTALGGTYLNMRQSDVIQARFRQVAISVLVAMGVVFIYLVYNATQFDDITDINAMDMAQVARNFAAGEGFTTKIIRPLSLTVNKSLERHPELTLSPLHPITAAGLFRLTGAPTARIMAWACGIAFLLTVGVTYLLALKIFNPQVALLALVIVATDAVVLQYAISGLESSLLTLLGAKTNLCKCCHRSRPSRATICSYSAAFAGPPGRRGLCCLRHCCLAQPGLPVGVDADKPPDGDSPTVRRGLTTFVLLEGDGSSGM